MNSAAVKRIMKELTEMHQQKSTLFTALPLEDNLFEWHFTIRGPRDTEFYGGVYHGRILLPHDYPLKPPDIIFLTPNGRFEVGKKVCLTISSYHTETWLPSWSIRTALLAIIGFMPTPGTGIGSLEWPKERRMELAKKSLDFRCPKCGSHNRTALPEEDENEHLNIEGINNIIIDTKATEEKNRELTNNEEYNNNNEDDKHIIKEDLNKEDTKVNEAPVQDQTQNQNRTNQQPQENFQFNFIRTAPTPKTKLQKMIEWMDTIIGCFVVLIVFLVLKKIFI